MSSNNGLRNAVELAVARLRQDAKGAMALTEWIGKGAMPVDHELAEARAAVCARCPQNVRKKRVENTVAETIRKHEALADRLGLAKSGGSDYHGLGNPDDREIGDIPFPDAAVDAFVGYLEGMGVDTGKRGR